MSNQEQERLDLIDKFKRLAPFYQQYMKENSAFKDYQDYLANREHNRQIINNVQQHIESEKLEEKVKLVESIRGTGWKRSKYVLFRAIALLFVFYSCWLSWGVDLLRLLPEDFVYNITIIESGENYTRRTLEMKYSVYLYSNIIWLFISILLSIYLPFSYYNRRKLGKTNYVLKNKRFLIVGLIISFIIILFSLANRMSNFEFNKYGLENGIEILTSGLLLNPYVISAVVVQVIYLSYLAKKAESNPYYSNEWNDGSSGSSIEKNYESSINRLQDAQKWFDIYNNSCQKYEERNGSSIYENILNHPLYQEMKDSIPEYFLQTRNSETPKVSPLWLSEILAILQAGRADTLKEAINVKISDDDRDEMLGKIKAAERAASYAESQAEQARLDAARARDEAFEAQQRARNAESRANSAYYRP